MGSKRTYAEILKLVENQFNLDIFNDEEYQDVFHAMDELRMNAKDNKNMEKLIQHVNTYEMIQNQIEYVRTQAKKSGRVLIADKINALKKIHASGDNEYRIEIIWEELRLTTNTVKIIEECFFR